MVDKLQLLLSSPVLQKSLILSPLEFCQAWTLYMHSHQNGLHHLLDSYQNRACNQMKSTHNGLVPHFILFLEALRALDKESIQQYCY